MDILVFVIYFIVPIGWWLITARKKESFFSWIGLKKPTPRKSLWILAIVNVVLNYVSLKYITPLFLPQGLTVQSQYAGMGWSALPSILYFGLIDTGFSEEFFFRGFLLKRLQNRFGFVVGNTLHAAVFGLMHFVPLITLSISLWFPATMFFLVAGLTGWMYGYISEKSSGGSIIPVILIHGVGNVTVSLLYAFNLM